MNGTLIKYGLIGAAVLAYFGYTWYQDSQPQTADLGQVLDRAEFALQEFSTNTSTNGATEASEEVMVEFTSFMTAVMNAQPAFYDSPVGVELKQDATFLGFDDLNGNTARDDGEEDIFKLEIDTENSRLIATDMTGDSVHTGYRGTGLLTGLLIGSLLARQGRSGISRGSFNNRQTTARSSYAAKSSARSRSRSGGSKAGK